ncbi:uncharacterized protein LOC125774259 [Anopheles funestus]|uniref:uncharacterized protein LOC125774259 n=1 Tax=Anopheles funestus TaxID=62324 RepID=UPI0020C5B739|nr:uncharacterized protein LOC125774259 [Anopheles funestus]
MRRWKTVESATATRASMDNCIETSSTIDAPLMHNNEKSAKIITLTTSSAENNVNLNHCNSSVRIITSPITPKIVPGIVAIVPPPPVPITPTRSALIVSSTSTTMEQQNRSTESTQSFLAPSTSSTNSLYFDGKENQRRNYTEHSYASGVLGKNNFPSATDDSATNSRSNMQENQMLEKILKKLENIEVKVDCLLDHVCCSNTTVRRINFEFTQIDCLENFQQFNDKLGQDPIFYNSGIEWLSIRVTEQDLDNRMHEALDLLFDRHFFSTCSWSGKGKTDKKIALKEYSNFINFFKSFAGNKFQMPTDDCVKTFFLKKLSHGVARAKAQGIRKTSCHKKRRL